MIGGYYNDYDKYSIWDNKNKDLWNDKYKPIFEKDNFETDLIDNIKCFIKLDEINKKTLFNNIIDDKGNNIDPFQNISEYKKQHQLGGYDIINSLLGINAHYIKKIDSNKKKVISISLFDKAFEKNLDKSEEVYKFNREEKKIHEYVRTLISAISGYRYLLPDWIIRIYIDDSIMNNESKNRLIISSLLEKIQKMDNIELVKIEMAIFKEKLNHIGLLGVIFRYHALFDPDIINCFFADSDNYPTIGLKILIEKWLDSKYRFMAFMPYLGTYQRMNSKDECIPNILAGMFGFIKENNEIMNPLIWQNMFRYIDRHYKNFKEKKSKEPCEAPVFKTPFHFSFEEAAITNIIIPIAVRNNETIFVIPIQFTNTLHQISTYFTDDFKRFIYNKLKFINDDKYSRIDLNDGQILNEISNDKYSPYSIIILNIIYKHINNNYIENIDKSKIYLFSDLAKIKKMLSIISFSSIYPNWNISFEFQQINNIINKLEKGEEINCSEIIPYIYPEYIVSNNKLNCIELEKELLTKEIEKLKKNEKELVRLKKDLEDLIDIHNNKEKYDKYSIEISEGYKKFNFLITEAKIKSDLKNNIKKYKDDIKKLESELNKENERIKIELNKKFIV